MRVTLCIANGKTKVRPLELYHGKVGRGLSAEMSVQHGPVTLLSMVEASGAKLKLLVAEGESVPGPILEMAATDSQSAPAPSSKAGSHKAPPTTVRAASATSPPNSPRSSVSKW